jgi:hypothetical protein
LDATWAVEVAVDVDARERRGDGHLDASRERRPARPAKWSIAIESAPS